MIKSKELGAFIFNLTIVIFLIVTISLVVWSIYLLTLLQSMDVEMIDSINVVLTFLPHSYASEIEGLLPNYQIEQTLRSSVLGAMISSGITLSLLTAKILTRREHP